METSTMQRMKAVTVSVILFSFWIQLFTGCGSSYPARGVDGKKYSYVYQLTDPAISPKMEFKDSQVSVTFSIDDAAISYTVLNLTTKPLILESGSAMIGIDSIFVPVRNRISLYSDSVKGFAPLVLPGRGYIEDMIIPRDNIYWTEEGWLEKDLFSTLDSGTVTGRKNITKNIGKKLEVYLPMKIGGYKMDYQFKFKVTAIKVVSPDRPIAEKQRPPAPSLFSGNINPWITVGVAAGIALVSGAIILSTKKPVGPLN
ncbi:MAG: DUF883 C-terminal domain-containing protein [Bacteroidota bacterium]